MKTKILADFQIRISVPLRYSCANKNYKKRFVTASLPFQTQVSKDFGMQISIHLFFCKNIQVFSQVGCAYLCTEL